MWSMNFVQAQLRARASRSITVDGASPASIAAEWLAHSIIWLACRSPVNPVPGGARLRLSCTVRFRLVRSELITSKGNFIFELRVQIIQMCM